MSIFDDWFEVNGSKTPWDEGCKLPEGMFFAAMSYSSESDREEQEKRLGIRRYRAKKTYRDFDMVPLDGEEEDS